jgi:AraC family transcriptional regulator
MTTSSKLLASGRGWTVEEVVCTAGPCDPPFEERHELVCIAAVTSGVFQYRSSQGSATLAPGALLLGNEGSCFECSHEHGVGDRCLSFHFMPKYFEDVVAAIPGVRHAAFTVPRLPPSTSLLPLIAAAETAEDGMALEEIAVRFAGAVVATLTHPGRFAATVSRRDERRVGEALHRIAAQSDETMTLAALAREAAMSPYHFLRVFRSVVGMTPHQFILGQRFRRAAVQLRRSTKSISTIAYDAGFNDLSTFNRRFRRIMGTTPSAYRVGC